MAVLLQRSGGGFVSKTQFSARVRFPLSSIVIGCLAQRVEPDHIKRSYFGN